MTSINLTSHTVYAEGFFSRFADILQPHLRSVGISPQVLQEPTAILTVSQYVEVLEVAARENQDDFTGLHLGEVMQPSDLGILGYALAHASTLEHFLHIYIRYFCVYADGVEVRLEECGDSVKLINYLKDNSIVERRQDTELALSFVHQLIKTGIDEKWKVQEVHFEHKEPKSVDEHIRIFNAPLIFDQPVNALVFSKAYLSQRMINSDQRLFPLLQQYLDSALLDRSDENDLVSRVSDIIARSLSSHTHGINEVAQKIGLPRWTLQRRLQDAGLIYSQLVSEVRRNLSEVYLNNKDIKLTEVAFLLGYSEVSAFSRAFRRWTGESPQEYRRRYKLFKKVV